MMERYRTIPKREELRGEKSKKNLRLCTEITRLSYLEKEQILTVIPKFFDNNKFKEEGVRGRGKIYQGKINGIGVELHFIKGSKWKLYLQPKYENKFKNELEKEDELRKLKNKILEVIIG